jgi:hypothetical protein
MMRAYVAAVTYTVPITLFLKWIICERAIVGITRISWKPYITVAVPVYIGANITTVADTVTVIILLIRVDDEDAIITAVGYPVTVSLLLVRIIDFWTVVVGAGISRETWITVTIIIRIGADITTVAYAVSIEILLLRVKHLGTVVLRALILGIPRVTIAITVRIKTLNVLIHLNFDSNSSIAQPLD